MRWISYVAVLLIVAGLTVGATLLWVQLDKVSGRSVPLTAGMAGEWTTVTKRFDTRIQHRFPTGSSESDLGTTLSQQGFDQVGWGGVTGAEHQAVRREDNLVCKVAARVYWRANASRRLTSIRGTYNAEGCL